MPMDIDWAKSTCNILLPWLLAQPSTPKYFDAMAVG